MKRRLPSTLPWMVASLTIVTVVAAAVMAFVYTVTKDPIAQSQRQKMIDAVAQVLPAFDNDPMADVWTDPSTGLNVYVASKDGEIVGAAVQSGSPDGFAGEIGVIFGFDATGKVTGYSVISQAETPGLGAKMDDWFRDPQGSRSVIGRDPGAEPMTVAKDGGEIDGITAATISSRAFLQALRRAYQAFNNSKQRQ
jgi:electron transport complex protein RnfG